MDVYLKAVAGALVAVIFALILAKQGKDLSILLILAVCGMVITAAVTYLAPVKELLLKLEQVGQLSSDTLTVMLKAVGIGLVTEVTCMICADAGNSALGKTVEFLSSAVILWLSVPLLTQLLELLENILGEI